MLPCSDSEKAGAVTCQARKAALRGTLGGKIMNSIQEGSGGAAIDAATLALGDLN